MDDWIYPIVDPARALGVDEHLDHDTGLLDKNGDKIYRQPRPIGFGRDNEWRTSSYLPHKS